MKVIKFAEFSQLDENQLKKLIGKSEGEDLTEEDARQIGKKISQMEGKDRQKYIGIVNFMGASCKIFNQIWASYKPVDQRAETENDEKEFHKEGAPSEAAPAKQAA